MSYNPPKESPHPYNAGWNAARVGHGPTRLERVLLINIAWYHSEKERMWREGFCDFFDRPYSEFHKIKPRVETEGYSVPLSD